MSNTSIAAPAICLFFNALIKACSSMIGPRDALINRAVAFIRPSSAAPARPRVRLLKDVGPLEQLVLGNQDCARSFAASGVMFWLQYDVKPCCEALLKNLAVVAITECVESGGASSVRFKFTHFQRELDYFNGDASMAVP
jgi:hypothetical protein